MTDQTIFVVPDPHARSRASDYIRRCAGVAIPAKGQRSERVAKVLLRLTGRSGLLPAGLKANGKPDERYTRVVTDHLFDHHNPFSASSSRDQTPADTPRDVSEQPIEIIEEQQVVHEEILAPPSQAEPEMADPAPPKPKSKTKRDSRAAESTQ